MTSRKIELQGKTFRCNYQHLAYPPSHFEIFPQDIPIDIVYEDDDIILVNKQPDLWYIPALEISMVHC
jgi:23S rRNA-/tRNA-specific pseudouridylate synthase